LSWAAVQPVEVADDVEHSVHLLARRPPSRQPSHRSADQLVVRFLSTPWLELA
jgi:hypothetical protein